MKNSLNLILVFILVALTHASCKKNMSSGLSPTILSVSPTTGGYGTLVTIIGTHFDSIASNLNVSIGGVQAIVQTSTDSVITLIVPVTKTGPVIVTTAAGSAKGPVFTFIETEIFVAGYGENVGQSNSEFAAYWENGIVTKLGDEPLGGAAYGIALSGNDVYVAGYQYNGNNSIAVAGKNGGTTALTDGKANATAYAVTVSGNDVFAAGFESNGTNDVAKVWKNGIGSALTDGTENAHANAIAVSGNDLYVAGYEYNGSINVAMFWKNGVAAPLTDGSHDAMATSIAISGSDVYVAGYERKGYAGAYVAEYWKNGVSVLLGDGSNDSYAYGIAVSGNLVCVAGYSETEISDNLVNVASAWVNGVPTLAPIGNSQASGIAIDNNDVYVGGSVYNGSIWQATYWKNGVSSLINNATYQSTVYGIAVKN